MCLYRITGLFANTNYLRIPDYSQIICKLFANYLQLLANYLQIIIILKLFANYSLVPDTYYLRIVQIFPNNWQIIRIREYQKSIFATPLVFTHFMV